MFFVTWALVWSCGKLWIRNSYEYQLDAVKLWNGLNWYKLLQLCKALSKDGGLLQQNWTAIESVIKFSLWDLNRDRVSEISLGISIKQAHSG